MGIHTACFFVFFRLRNGPDSDRNQRWGWLTAAISSSSLSPPLPFLHSTGPSHQNKIVISMAEASPFYWRLSDARIIMSDLGFDRPTRERLVLQGESMAVGHIPINRLPQLFLLMLPALWQIRCFIREQIGGGWRSGGWMWQHRSMLKITQCWF